MVNLEVIILTLTFDLDS